MAAEYDVLIVDDDVMQANALAEVVSALGFSSRVLPDGARVLEEARRAKPRLLILDIIMPGTDGLSLCMKLKPDVLGWGGRIAVASGKDRTVEEPRAMKAGAELFLPKPYRVRDVKEALGQLLGSAPAERAPAPADLAVKIWGSRGRPVSGALMGSQYGTRTPCVSVGLASGDVYIFDGGSGLLDCGAALVKSNAPAATLMLTHYHAAHVEGLHACELLQRPGFELRVAGPMDPDTNLSELCQRLGAKAKVSSFFIEEREYRFSDRALMSTTFTNHPTTTLAYSLRLEGRKIVYCPDAELPAEDEVDVGNNFERLRQFAAGADLLLLDAARTPEDKAGPAGKGHSSWEEAVRLASEAGVRRLQLFHAGASYNDAKLAELEAAAKQAASERQSALECGYAKDGAVILL
ncbi:MAG: response regulator [Elusimicrobia bacterium]|nr:response regulator [Elusimicrobiota bacterium]